MRSVSADRVGCQSSSWQTDIAEITKCEARARARDLRPWLYVHTRTSRPKAPYKLRVFADALEVVPETSSVASMSKGGGSRGMIEKLSNQSSARLRRLCLTKFVPEWDAYALTMTYHRFVGVNEHKEVCKRFFRTVRKAGIPCIYRHEMQRRGVPHLHIVVWLQPDPDLLVLKSAPSAKRFYRNNDGTYAKIHGRVLSRSSVMGWSGLCDQWLMSSREYHDIKARKYSVRGRKLDDQDRWALYMALHNSKKGQDNYCGKQWGVINKLLLRDREHEVIALSDCDHAKLMRRIRKWYRRNRERQVNTGRRYVRLCWGIGKGVPGQLCRGLGVHESRIEQGV